MYNACIYIHSILISGSDSAAGGQACPEVIRNPVAIKLLVSYGIFIVYVRQSNLAEQTTKKKRMSKPVLISKLGI